MPKIIGKKRKTESELAAETAAQELVWIGDAAAGFKALGDPTRLRIVLFLCAAFPPQAAPDKQGSAAVSDGSESGAAEAGLGAVTVGAIALHLTGLDKVTSNVSHHLKELRHAGLITMKRRGKNILCQAAPEALAALTAVLCGGGGGSNRWLELSSPEEGAAAQ
ncbi:MAG: helix-turn-helix transcriptional regulator [Cytophagales bacterium]|nr:helix-turn-helix transcriptional regulator [Armatimonadota bacterium]